MYVYLIRHAVAHKRDQERWPDDSRRPLTPEGEEEFEGAARGLTRVVSEVEVLLSSPYQRAWRTAEILAEQAGWPAPVTLPALEPDIPSEKVVLALEMRRSATILRWLCAISRTLNVLDVFQQLCW